MTNKAEYNIQFPDNLPITASVDTLSQALKEHQIIIVAGETGSGKSTQLAKLALHLGLADKGIIGHTQPRRVAARNLASRVAEEMQASLGQVAGYQVRFSDITSENTLIKFMTDGILLSETVHDPLLKKYSVLIIDEAHERSLNIDFLLGYLKKIVKKRSDLKIIITSATIDVERFSQFYSAPIIQISGRTYPVSIHYVPECSTQSLEQVMLNTLEKTLMHGGGDTLVFLPGEREIRELSVLLRKKNYRNVEVLPLYSRLSVKEQQRVFKPSHFHRIILSTNVAETSVTVPNVRYVIDTGTARISRYSQQSKIQRLPIEKISQASANQRAGRCGRVQEGVCYRLYSEEDFLSRPKDTEPEIVRTNLSAVILQMLNLGLGNIDNFPFLEAPDARYIRDGLQTLLTLQAITEQRQLTPLGRKMAGIPVDPALAKIILSARNCLKEILIIISALTIQDPRERPFEYRQAADEFHRQFSDESSDFITWVRLWEHLEEQRQALSNNQFRKYCDSHFLSFQRIQEWRDIHRQLHVLMKELGLRDNQIPADYISIHKALLAGFVNRVANYHEIKGYLGPRGTSLQIFPGSALKKQKPKWVLSAEVVELQKIYARCVAKIEPEWIEEVAPHLVKKHYSEPHWLKAKGFVGAYEKVTFLGLSLIEKRRVHYGKVNPEESRDIFIREALVKQQLQTSMHFYQHNAKLIQEINAMEDRLRRMDVLVAEDTLFELYSALIPKDVYSQAALERWYKEAAMLNPTLLCFSKDALMNDEEVESKLKAFPEEMKVNNNAFHLHYEFKPGEVDDGITVDIPLLLLNQVNDTDFDALVPGLRLDKVIALLKVLPKSIRRMLVPLPDFARQFLDANSAESHLIEHLVNYINEKIPGAVKQDNFELDKIAEYLKVKYRLIDIQGNELAHAQSLAVLKKEFLSSLNKLSLDSEEEISESYTTWSFGTLPESVEKTQSGNKVIMYPYLKDNVKEVSLCYHMNKEQANKGNQQGTARLITLHMSSEIKYIQKELKQAKIHSSYFEDVIYRSIVEAFNLEEKVPRNPSEFEALLQSSEQLIIYATRIIKVLQQILPLLKNLEHCLAKLPTRFSSAKSDMENQLKALFQEHFVRDTKLECLQRYPVYLQALSYRLERIEHNPGFDMDNLKQIQSLLNPVRPALRWDIEELRVGLFAPHLKPLPGISLKRIKQKL